MPREDALRWNERYIQGGYENFLKPRPFLVNNMDRLPHTGKALDVAMGLGGNSSLLLERGLTVIGVDISSIAVFKATRNIPGLLGVIADLSENILFASQSFDVILNFYYLQRPLWPDYRRVLRPGGLLVFETLTQDMNEDRADIDPRFLLQPGELREAFQDWDILAYREGWEDAQNGHRKATASLIARLP